jgi:cephalosporin-C deacetylase
MPSIDLPLEQLRQYKPSPNRPEDFDAFWDHTIAAATTQPLNAELIPYALHAKNVECFAVRFDGFEGGRIAGWYLRPDTRQPSPGIVFYHGYSNRGARPLELLPFASQGFCVLSMDCRGQNGQSQDAAPYPEGHAAGWMTQGIRDPRTYYYRYVYADALRALELLARRDEVDPTRLAVTGASQGGGLSLAIAALSERPLLALADIPFLCDFRRGISLAPTGPYPEFASFLRAFPHLHDTVLRTLAYFDCLNLAPWITCRTLISNCLCDDTCPPSTIFAVFHQIAAEKQLEIFPHHRHEVPYDHTETQFRLLMSDLRP